MPPEQAYLIRVAGLLHAYGTPAHRLERVMLKVADKLGIAARFNSTPTALILSLGEGAEERTHLLRSEPGEVDLGKLIEFDEIMESVDRGRLTFAESVQSLEAIAAPQERYPIGMSAAAFGVASGGAAYFLGGALLEMLAAFLLAVGLYFMARIAAGRLSEGLFEPLAALFVASASLGLAQYIQPLDDRVVTLSGLIILIPGLTLTVSMIELATRHLVSGVARLAGAAVLFLLILLGVAMAWRLGEILWPNESVPLNVQLATPNWTEWAALATAPLAFAIILKARVREMAIIWITGVCGYLGARFGTQIFGPDMGAFLGALIVGLFSNFYARYWNRPALVPLTPGVLLLVPGSLGFRSLTSFLEQEALEGMEWAFQTSLVAVSLVGGLLFANLFIPPRRVL